MTASFGSVSFFRYPLTPNNGFGSTASTRTRASRITAPFALTTNGLQSSSAICGRRWRSGFQECGWTKSRHAAGWLAIQSCALRVAGLLGFIQPNSRPGHDRHNHDSEDLGLLNNSIMCGYLYLGVNSVPLW